MFNKKERGLIANFENRYTDLHSRYRYLPFVNKILAFLFLSKDFSLIFLSQIFWLKFKRYFKYIFRLGPKVGFLVEDLDKGGLEQVVFNLVTSSSGIKPYVFVRSGEYGLNAIKLIKAGFYVYVLDNDSSKFLNILSAKRISVINSHFSVWNFQEIHNLGIKIIYTIHSNYTWFYKVEDIEYRKIFYDVVDVFVAVSSNVKEYFSKKFEVSEDKITVIMNGLNIGELEAALPKRHFMNKKREFTFLNVGAFIPVKNHLLMLSAFSEVSKQYPNTKFYFVGNNYNDGYYSLVKDTVKEYGLEDKVEIIDFVSKGELTQIYRQSDCFVLPSLQEGCSNVLLEAMYYELPIIASDVGSARELIGEYGILIPNSYKDLLDENTETLYEKNGIAFSLDQANRKDLVEAMVQMIEEKEEWQRRTKGASRIISVSYNVESMVESYAKTIKKVIKGVEV